LGDQNLNASNDMVDDELKNHNTRSSQETSVGERIRFCGSFISAWLPVLVIIVSIIFYIVDVGTDLRLAYNYYAKKDYWVSVREFHQDIERIVICTSANRRRERERPILTR